jgi:hypothetical protein
MLINENVADYQKENAGLLTVLKKNYGCYNNNAHNNQIMPHL